MRLVVGELMCSMGCQTRNSITFSKRGLHLLSLNSGVGKAVNLETSCVQPLKEILHNAVWIFIINDNLSERVPEKCYLLVVYVGLLHSWKFSL